MIGLFSAPAPARCIRLGPAPELPLRGRQPARRPRPLTEFSRPYHGICSQGAEVPTAASRNQRVTEAGEASSKASDATAARIPS